MVRFIFVISLLGFLANSNMVEAFHPKTISADFSRTEQYFITSGDLDTPKAVKTNQPSVTCISNDLKEVKKKAHTLLSDTLTYSQLYPKNRRSVLAELKANSNNLFLLYHINPSLWQSFLL